jgi:hypothetical protein
MMGGQCYKTLVILRLFFLPVPDYYKDINSVVLLDRDDYAIYRFGYAIGLNIVCGYPYNFSS